MFILIIFTDFKIEPFNFCLPQQVPKGVCSVEVSAYKV